MPPLRPCLGCGKLTHDGGRCGPCRTARAAPKAAAYTRAKRARRPYTAAEQARRAEVVRAWRATHGDVCPGWRRPPHPAADLTADHPDPVGRGGSEAQPLGVLCRTCNGRKGADRQHAG